MQPRVAFFTDSFHEVNGVALTSRTFEQFAISRGYPFFSFHAGPETRCWKEGALTRFEVATSALSFNLDTGLRFDLRFWRHRVELRSALEAFAPDVIHITGPSHAGILGAIFAHELKKPLVASWHTNIHEFGARRVERMLRHVPGHRNLGALCERVSLMLTIYFYQRGDVLLAPNPELIQMLSVTGKPAFLMRRGVDTNLFTPERRRRTAQDAEFVIGYVGRITPEKNVRLLCEIERGLLSAGIDNYRFSVVGQGSEREWLEKHLQRARFPGLLKGEALANEYANFDVFVFPSETDTFGNVVQEALASGVPAIVSGGGGPKFLVCPGETGFVAGGAAEFAAAVAELAKAPEKLAEMRKAARAAACEASWERVFERVYDSYRYAGSLIAGANAEALAGSRLA